MSTERSMRDMAKRLRVNIRKPSELRAWAKYLGCSQQNIRDAVHSSGVMVPDVRDWLRINVVRSHSSTHTSTTRTT